MNLQSLKDVKTTIGETKVICLFGIGALLNDCYDQLVLSLPKEPDFFCDNSREKWGATFFDKKCISPSELGKMGSGTMVIITVRNYEHIYEQLTKLGFKDIFVCCYDRGYNTIRAIKRVEGDQLSVPGQENYFVPVQDKWTLITGAARGVGYQIALEMAKLGSNIVAHSRSVSHVEKLVAACSGLGVHVVPIAAEFSDLTEVEAMLSQLEQSVPHVDIVFNNAAVSPSWPLGFWSAPSQDYLATYVINTAAPIHICQQLIPSMIQRGFGRVINVSSTIQQRPCEMAYACSKAALDKFVYDLAPSLQNTGVMLTLLDPGWLRSDMGGTDAPHPVESVIPGALLGALLDGDINGRWFFAQDYAGLSLPAAIKRANFSYSQGG
jgi:3-oxoacyl-[acyl-carrier protein] reductase